MKWYTVSKQADATYYTKVFWVEYENHIVNFLSFYSYDNIDVYGIKDNSIIYEHEQIFFNRNPI